MNENEIMFHENNFKYFKFGDIFEFERGTRLIHENQIDGEIPFISSSKFKHGIDNYIDPPINFKIYKNKLTLSNSGSIGIVFYHDYEFVASDHVTVIWIKDPNIKLNRYIGLFLKPIIESIKYKYGFAREISNTRLAKESIRLPSDEKGNPDWAFMENYIEKIDIEFNFKNKKNTIREKNHLSTDNWKYFKLGGSEGLFEITKGKATIGNLEYGEFPVISATMFNNGFNSYKDNGNFDIVEGNVITVSSNGVGVGKSFYQEDDFVATADVNILKLKDYKLNKYIALFLCTLIEKERFKYSYGRKFGLNKIKNSKIKLPVTKDNKPDWEFMENYINQLPYADHLLKSN